MLYPSEPLFGKEGHRRFYGNIFLQKIPLYPPFQKGEDIKRDSGQAGMTNFKV